MTKTQMELRSAEREVRSEERKAGNGNRFVSLCERYELIRQADVRARARLATNNLDGLTL